MPRARLLKPGFFKNEVLARLSERHRLLYEGLWTLADREGRLEDRPSRIKAEVFPYEEVDVEPLLADLARHQFIVRYSYDDPHAERHGRSHAIAIPTFLKHQTPHHREGKSSIPPPTSKRAHRNPSVNGPPPANDRPRASLGPAQGEPESSPTVPVYGDPVPVYGDPVPEAVPKEKSSAAGAARRPPAGATESPAKNVGIITRIAHDVIRDHPRMADGDVIEAVKRFCAQKQIAYDSGTVRKALESAQFQRARAAEVHR